MPLMDIEMRLWRVRGRQLDRVLPSTIESEKLLETLLETLLEYDPAWLGRPVLIIGRQVETDPRHFVDLLAIDACGNIWVIELKRDTTSREVVSQIVDYSSWAEELTRSEIIAIFSHYRNGAVLENVFHDHFGVTLPEEINSTQYLTTVAGTIDEKTKRNVRHLQNLGVPISIVSFQHFEVDGVILLSRAYEVRPYAKDGKSWALAGTNSPEECTRSAVTDERQGELLHSRQDESSTQPKSSDLLLAQTETAQARSFPTYRYHYLEELRQAHQQAKEFWEEYAAQFQWDFLLPCFLHSLHEKWLSENKTSNFDGIHLTARALMKRLKIIVAQSGEWEYTQASAPGLMTAEEPLAVSLPNWDGYKSKIPTRGLRRVGSTQKPYS
jgi:hypothetical protein